MTELQFRTRGNSSPSRAMDVDLAYAKRKHIPILPFMMETGIDAFYAVPEKFGELQYINPYSHDLTEISYEEKLKKYLESVLISDETAKRIRAVFDIGVLKRYTAIAQCLQTKNTAKKPSSLWQKLLGFFRKP